MVALRIPRRSPLGSLKDVGFMSWFRALSIGFGAQFFT